MPPPHLMGRGNQGRWNQTTGRGFRGGGFGGRGEGPPSFRGGGPGRVGRGTGGRMDHRGGMGGGPPPMALGRGDVISAARGSFYGGSGRGSPGRDGASRGRGGAFRGGRGRGRGRGRIATMYSNEDVPTTYGDLLHTTSSSSGNHLDMMQDDSRMSRMGTYESMAQAETSMDPYPPPPPPLPPSGPSDGAMHQPPLPPQEEQPPIPPYSNYHMNENTMGHYPREDASLHSGGSNIHSIGSSHAGPIPQTISPPKRFSSGSPGRGTFGRGRGTMGGRGRGGSGRGPHRGFQGNGYVPDHAPVMDNYSMGMEVNEINEEYTGRPTTSFTGGRDGGFSGPGRSAFGRDGPRAFGRGRGFRGGGRDGGRFMDQSGRGGRDGSPRMGGRIPRGGGRGFRVGGLDGSVDHYGRAGRGMDDQSQNYNVYGDNRSVPPSGGGGYASLAAEESNIGQYHSLKQPQYDSYHQGSALQHENRNMRPQAMMNNDDSYRNSFIPPKAKSPPIKPIFKAPSREHIVQAPPSPKPQEPVHVVPPSPPPAPPSNLAVEIARLTDLTAQMEFQYAKHLQCSIEHEIIKSKIATLKELPIGIDAFREDLDRLNSDVSSKETS